MEAFLIALVTKYPVAVSVFLIMGVCRALLKPTMAYLHAIAEATETPKDNEILDGVEKSKIYSTLVWFLDYVASIKLPGAK